jgi:Flp pilus assembly protein TadB
VDNTSREEREILQRRVDDLYARIEVLAAKYATLIPDAMRTQIDQEVDRNYREIHRLQAEIEELKKKEGLEETPGEPKLPAWIVGVVVSTILFVMAISAGSWPVALLGAAAAVWTVVDWHRPKSEPGKDVEVWRP